MLLTSFLAQARAFCRVRGKSGPGVGAIRKRPSARRAFFERLESRQVLSGGIVVASVGATTSDRALDSFLASDGKIVVAGDTNSNRGDFAALRFQANGSLDPTFDNDGVVVTSMSVYADYASAAVLYPATSTDPEKILLAGKADFVKKLARGQSVVQADFALARYNADGTLDRTFNYQATKKTTTYGTVLTDLGGNDIIRDALVQDGKIVVVGESNASGTRDFALARYTADGRLDSTFGGTGVVTTSFGRTFHSGEGVALQQGKILAVGYVSDGSGGEDLALARYNLNGTLDTTFGASDPQNPLAGTGKVVSNITVNDEIFNVAVYPAGSQYQDYIVVVGQIYGLIPGVAWTLGVARFTPEGSLDTGFGQSGFVLSPDTTFGYDVALQPDGKIVAAGWKTVDNERQFFVVRYDTSGNLDPTFGSGGEVTTPIPNLRGVGRSVWIQSDGKIVATGYAYEPASPQRSYIALARYDTFGNLDPSFGDPLAGNTVASPAALTDAALADAGRQQLALAALLQYEDQLQAKPAARSKGLEVPAIDLALLDLAS